MMWHKTLNKKAILCYTVLGNYMRHNVCKAV